MWFKTKKEKKDFFFLDVLSKEENNNVGFLLVFTRWESHLRPGCLNFFCLEITLYFKTLSFSRYYPGQ